MILSQRLRLLSMPWLLLLGVASMAACAPEDRVSSAPVAPGSVEGELALYTATLEDGRNEQQFFLRRGADETRLIFTEIAEPALDPGTAIRVWGKQRADGLYVTRLEENTTVGSRSEALINGTPFAARTFAFVFVDTGGGVNLMKDEATKRLFGTNMGQWSHRNSSACDNADAAVIGLIR